MCTETLPPLQHHSPTSLPRFRDYTSRAQIPSLLGTELSEGILAPHERLPEILVVPRERFWILTLSSFVTGTLSFQSLPFFMVFS